MRIVSSTALLVLCLLHPLAPAASAQQDRRGPQQEKLRERIGDLRKVKLLDILDLQGDQVERFFTVYNTFETKIIAAKEEIDQASRDLQATIGNDGSEAELQKLTRSLREKIQAMENVIEARFDEARKVLTTKQYAQYVVFEARFRDELQGMILDRMRRMRDRR